MTSPFSDTDAETEHILARRYREMTSVEKFQRIRDLTLAANELALAGLRMRHPGDSEGDLLVHLARLRLGDALVAEAYGVEAPTPATPESPPDSIEVADHNDASSGPPRPLGARRAERRARP